MDGTSWENGRSLSGATAGGQTEARLWLLALAALVVLIVAPFFLVDVPPVLDYPNHLARLYVLAFGADDPALSAMYAPHWSIVPNLAIDLVGPPLMHLLPVSVVGRVLLALAALIPVAGVILYHRAVFGVRSWWPLASGVIAFNGILFFGFMNYLYAVGLAFMLAAYWIALRARHPLVAVAGSAAGVVVLFFCHIAGPLLFALLAGLHEVVLLWRAWRGRQSLRQRLLRLAGLFLALLPAVALFVSSALAETKAPLEWEPPMDKLVQLFTPLASYDPRITLLSAMVAVAVLIYVQFRRPRIDAATALAFLVIAAAYVVAPRRAMSGSVIEVRLTIVLAFLLVGGVLPVLSSRAARVVGVALAAVVVVRAAHVASVWVAHRSDLADLRAVIAPVPPGARVLAVSAGIGAPKTYVASEPAGAVPPIMYHVDEHLPALLVIERHAFWPQLFADPRQQPVVVRPAYAAISNSLGEPQSVALLASDRPLADPPVPYMQDWPGHFDYVLVLDAGALADTALRPDRLDLVKATHFAALYRIRRAATPGISGFDAPPSKG